MVDGTRSDHQSWVEGASSDTAERVPCSVVEPVPEVVEAIVDEVFCCAEVEPRIDCMREVLVSMVDED